MADKVLYQSVVHNQDDGIDREPLKKKYKRAVKQLVDTLAPGFNPRRTKNRKDVVDSGV